MGQSSELNGYPADYKVLTSTSPPQRDAVPVPRRYRSCGSPAPDPTASRFIIAYATKPCRFTPPNNAPTLPTS